MPRVGLLIIYLQWQVLAFSFEVAPMILYTDNRSPAHALSGFDDLISGLCFCGFFNNFLQMFQRFWLPLPDNLVHLSPKPEIKWAEVRRVGGPRTGASTTDDLPFEFLGQKLQAFFGTVTWGPISLVVESLMA